MKYVKLIAKKDTWFKEGTEALYEDEKYILRRLTTDEYEILKDDIWTVFVGVRICQLGNGEVENCGHKVGEERIDGEVCSFDEFDIEYVEEDVIHIQRLKVPI